MSITSRMLRQIAAALSLLTQFFVYLAIGMTIGILVGRLNPPYAAFALLAGAMIGLGWGTAYIIHKVATGDHPDA